MLEAEVVTKALAGRWYGHYGVAFCPAHPNTKTPALTLRDGDKHLLVSCKAGCDFRDVLASLEDIGLGEALKPSPKEASGARAQKKAHESARRIRIAQATWNDAEPVHGSVAETYLRSRGIHSDLPETLRFHPNAWHGSTASRLPALIGGVQVEGEKEPVGIHRTYLDASGTKADVTPVKAMLGNCRGGAVRLSDGDGPLVVAEGIETGLSLLEILKRRSPRIWAALSTSGVSGLILPDAPTDLVVAADADPAGAKAAQALAEKASLAGWSVRLLPPPHGFNDWNDVTQERNNV